MEPQPTIIEIPNAFPMNEGGGIPSETTDPSVVKTNGLAKRILSSPLFWNLFMATAATTFALVVTFAPITIPTLATITVLSLLSLGIIGNTASNLKRIYYEISLGYSIVQTKFNSNWNWYDEIVPGENRNGSITLGAMPLKTKNHHIELQDYVFLAMVEKEELRWTTCLSDPLTIEDRELLSPGSHKEISTNDFKPVLCDDLYDGAIWVQQQRNEGKDVYIHCKAGRYRSAAILLCYLLLDNIVEVTGNKKHDIDNAISYITNKRSQAGVSDAKRAEIGKFYDKYILNQE